MAKINLNKVCYDLALTYANLKLQDAIIKNKFSNRDIPPQETLEMNYLLDIFNMAYEFYSNEEPEFIKND